MQEALKSGNAALRRDPRDAPYGFLVNGEFLHEDVEAFMWFDSTASLASHLLDVQPMLLLKTPKSEAIESFREKVRLPLEQLLLHGSGARGGPGLGALSPAEPGAAPTEGMPRLPGVTRSRHGAARDKGCCAGRRPQAPCEPGRSGVRSSPGRVAARLEVPFQAVDGCARPGPCGGVGFTQGLSGLKRAFEFPILRG